jgi:hypothetical protein
LEEEMTMWNWIKNHQRTLWSVFLGLLAVVIFRGLYTPEYVGGIGSWAWSYVIPLFFLFLIMGVIVSIWATRLGTVTTRMLYSLLVMMAIFLFIITIHEWWHHCGDKQISQPEWQTLTMPANGDSQHIVIQPERYGYKVQTNGSGFETHCGYPDGHEGVINTGRKENSCTDGFTSFYVHDLSGHKNSISYEFVK